MDSDSADEESTRIVDGPAPAETTAPFADPVRFEAAPAPAAARNPQALWGVILAVPLWPAGLVLSALGLFNAVNRRTGKALAVTGLILSAAVGVAIVAALADATSTVAASTALDPGCASIEANLSAHLATLKADAATLESDGGNAGSSAGSIDTVDVDLGSVESDLTTAGGDATHARVKSDLTTMNTQVQAVAGALAGIKGHSTGSEGAAAAALATLQSTGADLDTLCAAY